MKHPSDGRSTVLVLTKAGKELLPKLIAVSKETNQLFLKLLPPDDAKNLLDLVRTLGERLPMNEIAGDSCDL
jgi:DNA-binding MarR family transcriptional regulator